MCFTPYYNRNFFDTIKLIKSESQVDPAYMTVRQLNRFLLDKNVLKEVVDEQIGPELISCRLEEKYPGVIWSDRKNEAGQALVRCLKSFDSNLTESRCL